MARRSAPFARIALDYADHPKIAGLSDAAFRAHIEMILYARRYKTDGLIPKRIAKRFGSAALSELMANDDGSPSLSIDDDGDYWIHDFSDWQETRAEIDAKSQNNRTSGTIGAQKRWRNAKHGASEPDSETLSETDSESIAETETETETEKRLSSEAAGASVRPEVQDLLDLLDAEMERNGQKPNGHLKRNGDAMRLLIDRDGHGADDIARIIRWCQTDEFWRTNILSASKLRDKFGQLSAKAGRAPRADLRAVDPLNQFHGRDPRDPNQVAAWELDERWA